MSDEATGKADSERSDVAEHADELAVEAPAFEVECVCGETFAPPPEDVDAESAGDGEIAYSCPACGESFLPEDPPDETGFTFEDAPWDEADEEPAGLFNEVVDAFRYPFQGRGRLFAGWLPVCFLGLPAAALGPIGLLLFGWLFVLFFAAAFGYSLRWARSIVLEAASGQSRFPDWPSPGDATDSLHEIFRLVVAVCGTLPILLPAVWAFEEVALQLDPALVLAFAWVITAAWFAVFSIGYLAAQLLGGEAPFRYVLLARSIACSPSRYAVVVVVGVSLLAGLNLLAFACRSMGFFVVTLVCVLYATYAGIVWCRLIGLYYHANRHRLDWLRCK